MGLDQKFIIQSKKDIDLEKEIYMRKLNVVQGYFENKYNIENLEMIDVDIKDIELLYKNSLKVFNSKNVEIAKELLPIQGGFFYGNYEYNDWYWEDVKEVLEITKEIIDYYEKDNHIIKYWCWY